MKQLIFLLVSFFFSAFPICSQSHISIAENFLNLAFSQNQNLDSAYSLCSEEIKADLTLMDFKSLINDVRDKLGVIDVVKARCNKDQFVYIQVKHNNLTIVWKIAFDGKKGVNGFFTEFNFPCEVKILDDKTEKILEFSSDTLSLNAIFKFPSNKLTFPVVLLCQGSGPNSADYKIGESYYFRELSEVLLKSGIGSVRLDKRSVTFPGTINTLYEEQIQDGVNVMRELELQYGERVSNYFLLGHSQGVNSLLSIKDSLENVKGLICLSGTTRDILDVLHDQLIYIDDIGIQIDSMLLKQVNYAKDSLTAESPSFKLPFSVEANYWLYLNQLNLFESFSSVSTNCLVLIGKHDYQLNDKDLKLWQEISNVNSLVDLRTYKKLNHMLAKEKKMASPNSYKGKNSIDKVALNAIVSFILNNN